MILAAINPLFLVSKTAASSRIILLIPLVARMCPIFLQKTKRKSIIMWEYSRIICDDGVQEIAFLAGYILLLIMLY